jgi:hypothetical protein
MKLLMVALPLVALLSLGCGRRAPESPQDRDRRFEAMMSGVTLVGRSILWNHDGLSGEERYVIGKVSKLSGDTWVFQARLDFGSHNFPLPIPVRILWAGDTPVITLTDLTIPGLGTYTARVLLYRDQYAGTWTGHGIGGQLFGRIVRNR